MAKANTSPPKQRPSGGKRLKLVPRLLRGTWRDYAIRTLKDNMIRLDLEPGSLFSENEPSVEMDLSRTPVREALIELSKVGIVEVYADGCTSQPVQDRQKGHFPGVSGIFQKLTKGRERFASPPFCHIN